jgi:hypothetical protein
MLKQGASKECCERLRKSLRCDARTALKDLLESGTAGCAVELFYFQVPEELRGAVLLCLEEWGAPADVLRACLRHFWKVSSRLILHTPGFSLDRARELFRQAGFPLPSGISPILRVWRGASRRTLLVFAGPGIATLPAGSPP